VNILAIGAHPDDLEFACAGTLSRCAQRGDRVTMVTTTIAELGNFELGREQTTLIRQREAAESAAIIGADYIALRLEDNTVNPYDPMQQRLYVDLVRQIKPDVIICHNPNDYHTDHRNVPELVIYTGPLIGLSEWLTEHPAWEGSPAVYFMSTISGAYFEPTHYVDITQNLNTKQAMLKAHASQLGFLKRYFNMDALEHLEVNARYWGIQAGVKYAEPFVQYKGYGFGNLTIHHLP
jgi:LmbE family N-acetylglucosaminyl deacetylase